MCSGQGAARGEDGFQDLVGKTSDKTKKTLHSVADHPSEGDHTPDKCCPVLPGARAGGDTNLGSTLGQVGLEGTEDIIRPSTWKRSPILIDSPV